jgi:hypothetical protein
MTRRALLLLPALVSTLMAVGVGEASAATLFTTAAHTTRVTAGATKTITETGSPFRLTRSGATIDTCTHAQAHTVQNRNDDVLVADTIVAAAFAPCNSPFTGNFSTPWKITVSGTGTTSGGFTRWNAAIDNVSFNFLGGTYTGNLTTGVTVTQPTATGAPICIHLNAAGSVSGPLTGDLRFHSTLCYSGAAALYSLT